MRRILVLPAILLLALTSGLYAKGSHGGGHGHSRRSSHHARSARHTKAHCATCPRDAAGRIVRNSEARQRFMKETGYAHGRPGYVVDHVVPLECGGADASSNMQWQTVAAAKAKDAIEHTCRK